MQDRTSANSKKSSCNARPDHTQSRRTRTFATLLACPLCLHKRPNRCVATKPREWDGPAVLPPLTTHRASLGVFEEHEERTTMPYKTVAIAHTNRP
jgi:hypothetical protein